VADGVRLMAQQQADIEWLGHFDRAEPLLQALPELAPDVLVMDIRMPGMNGLELLLAMRKNKLQLPVIVFSMFDQPAVYAQLRLAGAQGYVLKISSLQKLFQAIRMVDQGHTYFDPDLDIQFQKQLHQLLTPREIDVLKGIAKGHTSQQLADSLFISIDTINTHRKNLIQKLHLTQPHELAQVAGAFFSQ